MKTIKEQHCLHCSQSLAPNQIQSGFCCLGCKTVYSLLQAGGFEKYYELKSKSLKPLVGYFSKISSFDWIDSIESTGSGYLKVSIQGVQCAACVWLILELGKKMGDVQVHVDSVLGSLSLSYNDDFPVKKYLQQLEKFGYRISPLGNQDDNASTSLLIRFGVCVAIAMNTMFLAISLYLGLDEREPELFHLFHAINFYGSFLSVIVGGSYFFKRAYQGLQKGILHFDLPVSIGILGAFGGSVYFYSQEQFSFTFFDTLNVFIALMLLGRYLQDRLLLKNKQSFVANDVYGGFKVKRMDSILQEISFGEIQKDDKLLVAPGMIFPVDLKLSSLESVECSLASINGESRPEIFKTGQIVPAGALLLSLQPVEGIAQATFSTSVFSSLLPQEADCSSTTNNVNDFLAKYYVMAVLGVSVLGVLFWSFVSWEKALMVGVSILVVTCPCSIGIAMPLARLWLQRHLSSLGVVLKNERLIDEWLSLKHIFLDKTGTLTYDKLILKNESEIQKLTEMDKKILYNLSARSLHPASLAIFQSMASHQFEPLKMEVNEVAGIGLYTTYNGERYFLGKGEHGDNQNLNDTYLVVFSKENSTLASFILEETMLENLAYTVEKLIHEGKRLTLISGDQQQRVRAMAQVLGLGSEDAIGGLTPEKKADLVATTQVGSMMIGDGLNDRLALKQADLAGSPIWERAALAADIDFYFISTGLGWLSQLTPMIKIYKKVLRQNIGFAWIYNGLAISLALMGWITPLICAVIMPLGSLFIVSLTAYKMRRIV